MKERKPMFRCETCNEWVPEKEKHNRKRHSYEPELERPIRSKGVHPKANFRGKKNGK